MIENRIKEINLRDHDTIARGGGLRDVAEDAGEAIEVALFKRDGKDDARLAIGIANNRPALRHM